MTQPKFCKDCKHSWTGPSGPPTMCCRQPEIASRDAWFLAGYWNGPKCADEREKRIFGKCGLKGKLWEAKE